MVPAPARAPAEFSMALVAFPAPPEGCGIRRDQGAGPGNAGTQHGASLCCRRSGDPRAGIQRDNGREEVWEDGKHKIQTWKKTQTNQGKLSRTGMENSSSSSSNPSGLQLLSREFPAQIPPLPAVETPSIIQDPLRAPELRNPPGSRGNSGGRHKQGGIEGPPSHSRGLGAAALSRPMELRLWKSGNAGEGKGREEGRLPRSQDFPVSLLPNCTKNGHFHPGNFLTGGKIPLLLGEQPRPGGRESRVPGAGALECCVLFRKTQFQRQIQGTDGVEGDPCMESVQGMMDK